MMQRNDFVWKMEAEDSGVSTEVKVKKEEEIGALVPSDFWQVLENLKQEVKLEIPSSIGDGDDALFRRSQFEEVQKHKRYLRQEAERKKSLAKVLEKVGKEILREQEEHSLEKQYNTAIVDSLAVIDKRQKEKSITKKTATALRRIATKGMWKMPVKERDLPKRVYDELVKAKILKKD